MYEPTFRRTDRYTFVDEKKMNSIDIRVGQINEEIRSCRVRLQNLAHARMYSVYNHMTSADVGICMSKEHSLCYEIEVLQRELQNLMAENIGVM